MLHYAESNGKLPHQFIPIKTATLVPELRVKTCLWAELRPWCLSLQWKTCPWAENSDDILIIFWRFIGLLKYWWARPIKAAMNRRCLFVIYHLCGAGGIMCTYHASDPGSIPGRDKFPWWDFWCENFFRRTIHLKFSVVNVGEAIRNAFSKQLSSSVQQWFVEIMEMLFKKAVPIRFFNY